ncbi:MAG: hypothetical protein EOM80_18600 [Erysipelotrichia bacterium]|nr:hypothetical protein [Erysipelotrichia bacterium]
MNQNQINELVNIAAEKILTEMPSVSVDDVMKLAKMAVMTATGIQIVIDERGGLTREAMTICVKEVAKYV